MDEFYSRERKKYAGEDMVNSHHITTKLVLNALMLLLLLQVMATNIICKATL